MKAMAVDKTRRFQSMDELRSALEKYSEAPPAMARIDAFLKLGAAQGCSDVHLAVGVPPMLRMTGELLPISSATSARPSSRATSPRS